MILSAATVNVRSMRSVSRAQSVLAFLGGVQADIICLQECWLPFRRSYRLWEKHWLHGPSLWSGSNENKCDGIAVLIKNKMVGMVESTIVRCGRILKVVLRFCGVTINVLNVYSPQRQSRWEELQDLPQFLMGRTPVLMVGDFNCVLNRTGRRGAADAYQVDRTSGQNLRG